MSEREKYSPEDWRRLIRGIIVSALAYLLTAIPGLYLLTKGQIIPGVALLVVAHTITFVFQRWAKRLPRINTQSSPS
jgi:hypothetical protein